MKIFFINIRTQYGNSGDALINRELIKALRDFGEVQAYCGPEVDRAFIEDLQLSQKEKVAVSNTFLFTMRVLCCAIKGRAKENRVYSVGGLGDRYGGSKKDVLKDFAAFCLFCIYRMFGVKIISIGRSLGKMVRSREWSEKIRSIPVNTYLVRDTKTLAYCNKLGIKKAEYCPDLSWLMPHKCEKINQRPCLALTFRAAAIGKKDPEYASAVIKKTQEVVEELQKVSETKMRLLIFYQVESDREFAEKMYHSFVDLQEYEVAFLPDRKRLKDIETVYGQSMFHISNRLHSLLLGFKFGSLPIALVNSKNAKIVSTLRDSQLSDLQIELEADQKKTRARLSWLYENRAELFQQVISCEDKKRAEITEILQRKLQ